MILYKRNDPLMVSRLVQILKTGTQLSLSQNLNYLYYQFLLKSGIFHFLTPPKSKNDKLADKAFNHAELKFWPNANDSRLRKNAADIIDQTNSILTGKFLSFGMIEAPIDLSPKSSLKHWSLKRIPEDGFEQLDIKFIWEPARFTWAIKLAQAYHLTNDEKYVLYFWKKFSEFQEKNPLNLGPNWESAQEVALRLIALTISFDMMCRSSSLTDNHKMILLRSIADHADRIPPSNCYAKAQNNNHLISEAVGLYSAGIYLPHHPHAKKWKRLGLRWFNFAIENQILNTGEYIQHSNNYHRMMLILALWMKNLVKNKGNEMKYEVMNKLALAVRWLYGQFDPISGKVPNLGHNDGSLILPFFSAAYEDYRPILYAANRAFLGGSMIESRESDEISIWFGLPGIEDDKNKSNNTFPNTALRLGNNNSWATLQAAYYTSRPAHADQLQVNLFHQGHQITLDPGTYQYNALPPWDNGLSCTKVHNTITINGKDQMVRSGRFLWLDWAQAKIIDTNENMICAEHDGYRRINVIHNRTLKRISDNEWKIIDYVFRIKPSEKLVESALHWLIPNWPLRHEKNSFTLSAPFGTVSLKIFSESDSVFEKFEVFQKGLAISGSGKQEPLLGWYSPTYGVKIPAYSILFSTKNKLPITIISEFTFS